MLPNSEHLSAEVAIERLTLNQKPTISNSNGLLEPALLSLPSSDEATDETCAPNLSNSLLLLHICSLFAFFLPKDIPIAFISCIMWCAIFQVGLGLAFAPGLFAAYLYPSRSQLHQEVRQYRAETIASAKADSLAHPRNITELTFGPQLYEAPLFCVYRELIIDREFKVHLGPGHTIDQHCAIIASDVRPYIRDFSRNCYLETTYGAKDVDEKLLRAIQSDPDVSLVTCSFRDDNVFE